MDGDKSRSPNAIVGHVDCPEVNLLVAALRAVLNHHGTQEHRHVNARRTIVTTLIRNVDVPSLMIAVEIGHGVTVDQQQVEIQRTTLDSHPMRFSALRVARHSVSWIATPGVVTYCATEQCTRVVKFPTRIVIAMATAARPVANVLDVRQAI
jgi:hypothetical protein